MANLQTFLDLQERVIAYGYSEAHRTQIKAWINDSYRDLCRLRRWSWLIFTDNVVTTSGVRTVALPAPSGRELTAVLEVKPNDAAGRAGRLLYEDIDADDPWAFERENLAARLARGTPARYSLDGTNIVLDPIPDRAITYSVRHYDVPTTELSADADQLLTPDSGNQVIVYQTLTRAAAHDRNPTLVEQWNGFAQGALSALEAHEAARVVQRTPRARMPAVYGRRFR